MINVVIPTRDRPDLMRKVLADLATQSWTDLRLTVVDNGEDEETRLRVKVAEIIWGEGRITWVPTRPDTYSALCNVGVAVSHREGDSILLLNNDVRLPDRRTIEAMHAHLSSDVGVVGTRILQSDGTVNHDGTTLVKGLPYHIGRNTLPHQKDCVQVPAVTFACALIDRRLWDDLDGLDDAYDYGYEDTDFCVAAAERGRVTTVCRETHVVHDEHGTRSAEKDGTNGLHFYGKWNVTGRGKKALAGVGFP